MLNDAVQKYELGRSGDIAIPKVSSSCRGPLMVADTDGYFPAIRARAGFVPFPRTIEAMTFAEPGDIASVSLALRHKCPLVAYVDADDEGIMLPLSLRNFGCVGYPWRYEFTEDGTLSAQLEFGNVVRIVAERIRGDECYAKIYPVVNECALDPAESLQRADLLLEQAIGRLESGGEEVKCAVLQGIRASSPRQRAILGSYSVASVLALPFSVKLEVLACPDFGTRIEIILRALEAH